MIGAVVTQGQAEGGARKEGLAEPDRSVIAAFAKACKRAAALLGDRRGAEAIGALRHARRVLGLVCDEYRRCGRYGQARRVERAGRFLWYAEQRARAERQMGRARKLALKAAERVAGRRRKGGKGRRATAMSA